MALFGQSQFLQALGWAVINSFWQLALLWFLFVSVNQVLSLSASRKYQFAVAALLTGLGWFVTTFFLFYQKQYSSIAIFETHVLDSGSLVKTGLLTAALTYLLLLIIPAVRFVRNWFFVTALKRQGLQKAAVTYRLFVARVAPQLGIRKKVSLFLSEKVTSPLTIGYFKPIVLLPLAALNHLTPAQVEAILLHELSHIRRCDYLVNFLVSVVCTLLYFNPFARLLMQAIDRERETCCDESVLQYGYDRLGYAGALLQLEKMAARHRAFALGAAGKNNLLTRIEKIVGMEQKKTGHWMQMLPVIAALCCIVLFNSVLLISDSQTGTTLTYTNDTVLVPWQLDGKSSETNVFAKRMRKQTAVSKPVFAPAKELQQPDPSLPPALWSEAETASDRQFIPVALDEVESSLSQEEKNEVKETVAATKKVVGELQWKEIESAFGEVLNQYEKAYARQQYLFELDQVNWKNIEQNLKTNYDKVNWPAVQEQMNVALARVKLDSIRQIYGQALAQLNKLQTQVQLNGSIRSLPLPDQSMKEIEMTKESLRRTLDTLKAANIKKVIRL